MESHQQLAALLDLAEEIGLEVRSAPPLAEQRTGGGAVVRLRGREVVFLDPGAPVADRIDLLAGVLAARVELADRFLPPAVRELLDRHGPDGEPS